MRLTNDMAIESPISNLDAGPLAAGDLREASPADGAARIVIRMREADIPPQLIQIEGKTYRLVGMVAPDQALAKQTSGHTIQPFEVGGIAILGILVAAFVIAWTRRRAR